MSTKKIKISKNKQKQKSIRRTFVLFFLTFLYYFIRSQVVGAVVLIHPVCTSISFRVEGLFVLRPVGDLDFVSVFNLWA
jgi:hypothetical protein